MSYRGIINAVSLPSQLEVSAVESTRFGLAMGRLELGPAAEVAAETARDLVLESGLDVVVLRYGAGAHDWFARLLTPELVVIHADTLVYYGCDLTSRVDPGVEEGFVTRTAGATDARLVSDAVGDLFTRYGNHYAANPLFEPTAALEGYKEWAAGFVGAEDEGRSVLIVEEAASGRLSAMASLLVDDPGEIMLAGVGSSFRGQGVYPVLLGACERELISRGCRELHISTQVHNLAVIRAWSARGYRFELALQTVHLIRREIFDRFTNAI